jgi:LysW-gamma-L-lysine/LysW-L-ornithine aminotransferase
MFDIFTTENKSTSGLYAKQPLAFVRGEGAVLYDHTGTAYLDCAAGQGVANLGHAHPAIAAAIAAQAERLITLPESFYNDQRAHLQEKLMGCVPGMQHVFFCNSGTESVEAAIKLARLSTGRTKIIAALRGFHGRTYGALSATANQKYRQPFEPLVPGFQHVPYNNLGALEQAVNNETAAVILEVVQGEGGVHPGDPTYLLAAQQLCQEQGALLIIDEVQTGFGRTGRLFAIEHANLSPDLLCIAKSLAGGLPMGAVLMGARVQNLAPGLHTSTFGGNPLACAAALAVLEVMDREELPRQAAEKGAYLKEMLRQIDSPSVREVRGMGLMIGIEIKQKVAPILQALLQRRILALSAGLTVIRLLPPLVITYAQLDQVITALTEVLAVSVGEPSG